MPTLAASAHAVSILDIVYRYARDARLSVAPVPPAPRKAVGPRGIPLHDIDPQNHFFSESLDSTFPSWISMRWSVWTMRKNVTNGGELGSKNWIAGKAPNPHSPTMSQGIAMSQPTATSAGLVMGPQEWALLILLSILWGGSFFFGAVAVKEVGPFTVVLTRVLLAAILLYGFIRLSSLQMPSDGRTWAAFFGMGLLNNVIPFSLIFWGQTHIASGLASILNATTPLFTVLVAHILTKNERLTVSRGLGVVIGFAGVVVMIGADLLAGLGHNLLAQLAILGAAFSYALATIFGRRFRELPPISAAAGQVTASTVMMLPLML